MKDKICNRQKFLWIEQASSGLLALHQFRVKSIAISESFSQSKKKGRSSKKTYFPFFLIFFLRTIHFGTPFTHAKAQEKETNVF